jgi:mRNA interferase RelE/StbE
LNLAWTIKFNAKSRKQMHKLGVPTQQRIIRYLEGRIALSENPRLFGKELSGNLSSTWRYRVDDYRILCTIHDQTITVEVIAVGHRREIYH